jgi:sensor domain CHASE-containing protein
MVILRLFEFSAIFLIILAVITQVFIPFFRGTVYFPIFRKERKLEDDLANAKQGQVERALEKEVNRLNKYCVTCKFPEAKICMNTKSLRYNQQVLASQTCEMWEEREE